VEIIAIVKNRQMITKSHNEQTEAGKELHMWILICEMSFMGN
jgi:hypothetical protein